MTRRSLILSRTSKREQLRVPVQIGYDLNMKLALLNYSSPKNYFNFIIRSARLRCLQAYIQLLCPRRFFLKSPHEQEQTIRAEEKFSIEVSISYRGNWLDI